MRSPPLSRLPTCGAVALLGLLVFGCDRSSTVVIRTIGKPEYIRYRADEGSWGTPRLTQYGTYEISAEREFEVVLVCVNPDGSSVSERLLATTDEGDEWFIGTTGAVTGGGCLPPPEEFGALATISGVMKQPGNIFMWAGAGSDSAPWTFSFQVPVGTHDLVATSRFAAGFRDGRVLIRRAQEITGDINIPDIDLLDGIPLQYQTFSFPDTEADVRVTVGLRTRHGAATISGSSDFTAGVLPAAALRESEKQIVSATITSYNVNDGVVSRFEEQRAIWDLTRATPSLTPVPDVTYSVGSGRPAAHWAPYSGVEVSFGLYATCGNPCPPGIGESSQHVVATPGWLQDRASLSLAVDAPDYDEQWHVDTAQQYRRRLSFSSTLDDVLLTSSAMEFISSQ